jgi:hypothetical protein
VNRRTASAEHSAAKPALGDRSLHTRKRSRLPRDLVEDLAIGERGRFPERARLREVLRVARDRSQSSRSPTIRSLACDRSQSLARDRRGA